MGIFWSTRHSINNDIPSVTAIIETAVAVILYWWVAIHFETYLPLLLSAAMAPLVLLRSDQSAALGVRWFKTWEENTWNDNRTYSEREPKEYWLISMVGVLAILLAGLTAFFLTRYFLVGLKGWAALWRAFAIAWTSSAISGAVTAAGAGAGTAGVRGAVLGATTETILKVEAGAGAVVIAGAIAIAGADAVAVVAAVVLAGGGALAVVKAGGGAIAAAGAVAAGVRGIANRRVSGATTRFISFQFAIPLLLGVSLGAFLVSLFIRIAATLRHPYLGWLDLPRNFRRLIICTSPLQKPELVPGLAPGETQFTLTDMWQLFRTIRHSGGRDERALGMVFFPPALLLWFLPGWLYRLTLKSTALFW